MTHTSDKLFEIAAESDIPLGPGQQAEMTDEQFDSFKNRYRSWARKRDESLLAYLSRTPRLFRAFLAPTRRAFSIAKQVAWYLDEVIVRDPLPALLAENAGKIEERKIRLREGLQFLAGLREFIEAGYVLLAGRGVVDSPPPCLNPDELPRLVVAIAQDPSVRSALKEAVRCGYDERPDSLGRPVRIYQLRLDYGELFGFDTIEVPALQTVGIPDHFIGETLPRTTKASLLGKLSVDPFEGMQSLLCHEVHRTLQVVEAAQNLNAAMLFDRQVDEVIVKRCGVELDNRKQDASVTVFDLALPYFRNVPAVRLLELRQDLPSAFLDFRSRLLDIVVTARQRTDVDFEELTRKVQLVVIPQIRRLDAEMKALRKHKILACGYPLLAVVGGLVGARLGISDTITLTGAVGSAIQSMRAITDHGSARAMLESNPFYFIWKAGRG